MLPNVIGESKRHQSHSNAPLWSISVEICFYMLLPLWAIGLYRVRRIDWGLAYIVGTQLLIVFLQRTFLAFTWASTTDSL